MHRKRKSCTQIQEVAPKLEKLHQNRDSCTYIRQGDKTLKEYNQYFKNSVKKEGEKRTM